MPGAFREMLVDLTPDECLVQQHIGAVLGMDIRAGIRDRLFGINDVRQRLVFDTHLFNRVLGLGAGLCYDRHNPFTGITHLTDRKRIAPHLRRIEAVHQRIDRLGKLLARQCVDDTRHLQCFHRIDRHDARCRILRRHEGDMQHLVKNNISDVVAAADNKAPVLPNAPVRRDEFQDCWMLAHRRPPCAATAFTLSSIWPVSTERGLLALRRRSAASSMASMIWP